MVKAGAERIGAGARRRGVTPTAAVLASLVALAWSATAHAQLTEPCVYTDARGQLVITDNEADPNCAHLRKAPARVPFRAPGRITMTFAVAEMLALAHDAAERHGVDHRLVESLVEMESGFDPAAVSPKGALGLMQLMPARARQYGVANPFEPWQNLDGGVRHLRDLLIRFDGEIALALAAYNAGPGAVDRYGGIPPYRETQDYVRRVLYRYRQRVQGVALHP